MEIGPKIPESSKNVPLNFERTKVERNRFQTLSRQVGGRGRPSKYRIKGRPPHGRVTAGHMLSSIVGLVMALAARGI